MAFIPSNTVVVLSFASVASAQDGFKKDIADAVVWTILFVIFSIQAVFCLQCLIRVFSDPSAAVTRHSVTETQTDAPPSLPTNDKLRIPNNDQSPAAYDVKHSRAPYLSLGISIFLSVLSAVFGIISDFVPFPDNLSFSISQYVLQTVLDGFPIVYLYGAIVLFLRDRLHHLKKNTRPGYKHSNTYHCQTVVQALIFSLILCLDGGSAILQALLLKNIGGSPASADNIENDVLFWAGYTFRILSSVDLHISSYLALRRFSKYKAKDEVISVICSIVTPMYTANTFTTFLLELLRIKKATTPTFLVDLLSNIFYVGAVSFLLYKLCQNTPFFICVDTEGPSLVNDEPTESRIPDMKTEDDSELLAQADRGPTNFTERAWLELFRHYKKREEESEKDFFHKDMNSDSQVFSTLSVVTVFLATISVALTGIARDTYAEASAVKEVASQIPESNALISLGPSRLSPEDSVFSCFYLATLISLMAACLSGLASAIRSLMARNIRNFVSQSSSDGPLDRALIVTFIFTCLMMAMAVITLILGLALFVWDQQPVYVSVAMITPGCVFVLAISLAVFFHALDNSASSKS